MCRRRRNQIAATASRERGAEQQALEGRAEASGSEQEASRLCSACTEQPTRALGPVQGVADAARPFLVENGR